MTADIFISTVRKYTRSKKLTQRMLNELIDHIDVYHDLIIINTSALTNVWIDSDVWTKDKQAVGFSINITYSRSRTSDAIKNMWESYNLEAINDEALSTLVMLRVTADGSVDFNLNYDDIIYQTFSQDLKMGAAFKSIRLCLH